jgi:hypothetical protein
MKIDGWGGVQLNSTGYETVSKRTDWIRAVTEDDYESNFFSPLPDSNATTAETLKPRKASWGEWEKQDNAAPELTQTS